MRIHPFVNSDRKREPSDYPALAAFDIKVDRKSKFPVLLLAIATVCRTIANARLRSELTKGCTPEATPHPTPEAKPRPRRRCAQGDVMPNATSCSSHARSNAVSGGE